jgi:hypothetical protein
VIDPWNACVPDDKAKDYRSILDAVFSCLPEGMDKPAIVIIHHLRKQQGGDQRKHGRDLLSELSGSYVIGSACRVAFILEPASPDPDDDRVVFTCAKNNNGELGKPSAWHRRNGLFEACEGFDWKDWNRGGTKRRVIELEDLAKVFTDGSIKLTKANAAKQLQATTGKGQSASYEALDLGGRFADHLRETEGLISFKP